MINMVALAETMTEEEFESIPCSSSDMFTVDIVRLIRKLKREGHSFGDIMEILKEQGITDEKRVLFFYSNKLYEFSELMTTDDAKKLYLEFMKQVLIECGELKTILWEKFEELSQSPDQKDIMLADKIANTLMSRIALMDKMLTQIAMRAEKKEGNTITNNVQINAVIVSQLKELEKKGFIKILSGSFLSNREKGLVDSANDEN